jgi:hypothetical protein
VGCPTRLPPTGQNALIAEDARAVEVAYQSALTVSDPPDGPSLPLSKFDAIMPGAPKNRQRHRWKIRAGSQKALAWSAKIERQNHSFSD